MKKAVILFIVSLPALSEAEGSNLIFLCGAVCSAHSPAVASLSGEAFLSVIASATAEAKEEAKAGQISSTELINNAREYDGKSIVYVGEAVGDVMVRGDFAWVNINDGENAIGVWLSKELAGEIKFTGSYHSRGDRLEITGVFQRNCIQHGGDMDIHAESMRKISPGRVVSEGLDTTKRNFVFILLAALCLVFVFARRRRSR